MSQPKQQNWTYQWAEFSGVQDNTEFLFRGWIAPNTLEEFRDKVVLDAGCGNGQYMMLVAGYARRVVGVELNSAETARQNTAGLKHVSVVEGDIAAVELPERFDIVYALGVVNFTDDPERTVENLKRHLKPGGKLMLFVYAHEGTVLVRALVEPAKRYFFLKLPKPMLKAAARVITALLYPLVYSLYLLPLRFLPLYEYFQNWRVLSFRRNVLNIFDQLNAPQTQFIRRERVERWMNPEEFQDVHISHYKGAVWRASGSKR